MFLPVKYAKSISRNAHYMVKDGVGGGGSGSGGGVKVDIKTTRRDSLAAATTTNTSTITTTTYTTTILITTATTTTYIRICIHICVNAEHWLVFPGSIIICLQFFAKSCWIFSPNILIIKISPCCTCAQTCSHQGNMLRVFPGTPLHRSLQESTRSTRHEEFTASSPSQLLARHDGRVSKSDRTTARVYGPGFKSWQWWQETRV